MEKEYVSMEFDAKQMIRLLGNDLYDSPLAMLRENVQNAFDAILERKQADASFVGKIEITIADDKVIVEDNGIGMNREILANNYWKAGNSGKNNANSQAAGVVGHFGIGALANFGVCTRLEIDTHRFGEKVRYKSIAIRDNLNQKDSISIEGEDVIEDNYGTKVTASLERIGSISPESAKSYLKPYVEYIEIPIILNGIEISRKNISFTKVETGLKIQDALVSYTIDIGYGNNFPMQVDLLAYDIKYAGNIVSGYLYLNSSNHGLMGLRNGFGLSGINVTSNYNLGGVANLNFLIPTAGREAVSRESTQMVANIVKSIENNWTDFISQKPICDLYREFINYVANNFSIKRAKYIKIKLANDDSYETLGNINQENAVRYKYADGVDQTILNQYKNSLERILSVSDNTYRRRIQRTYLQQFGIKPVSNAVQTTKVYKDDDISVDQYFVLSELRSIIEEDYYIKDFEIKYADISHQLTVLVVHNLESHNFCIYISPDKDEIKHLLDLRKEHYNLFTPLAKDFVRLVLYPQFSSFIPKDIKERTDYITKVMHNRKEEYILTYEKSGSMDEWMQKLRNNEITVEEFARYAKAERNSHKQTISPSQVGDVSEVVHTINERILNEVQHVKKGVESEDFIPMPPILCLDVSTDMRILKTSTSTPILQNHKMFMALTDKTVKSKRIFFTNPHTTRVIWSMHRLIYIFTDALNQNSLYYDMELTHSIPDNSTGGVMLHSATIITKDKIFVPIVEELYPYFNLDVDDQLKFYVNFDEMPN